MSARGIARIVAELADSAQRLCLHTANCQLGNWQWCKHCGAVRAAAPTGDGEWHAPAWRKTIEAVIPELARDLPE